MESLFGKTATADAETITLAARLLRDGRLVAFPTETVYGLGADATNEKAVAGYSPPRAGREFNPLIVHVRDMAEAARHAIFSNAARAGGDILAGRAHPGIAAPTGYANIGSGQCRSGYGCGARAGTPGSRSLITAAGVALAAPSANVSGRVSATLAAHAAAELGDKVALVLDAGPTPLGIESTVVGFSAARPVLLRPGAVTRETIEALAGSLASPRAEPFNRPVRCKAIMPPMRPCV